MLRAVHEKHRLLQKEARASLVDKCLLSLYYVPTVGFEVNHTAKVPGADVSGGRAAVRNGKWGLPPQSSQHWLCPSQSV